MRVRLSFTFPAIFLLFFFSTFAVYSQTTEFNYQGNLKDGANAANGNYDFEFALFDALTAGTQLGATLSRPGVAVAGGTFAVKLDFGSQFPGANRFLEIHVRTAGGGSFTVLSPRQPVSNSPYSVKALNADAATTAGSALNATTATTATTATNATQLGGVAASQYVLTTDPRMSDARTPLSGSTSYIQNTTNAQANSNFNISGVGTVGSLLTANTVNSDTQYLLNSYRILGNAGTQNLFAGQLAGVLNTGAQNSFFGSNAASANVAGSSNSVFGAVAGLFNTSGSSNSFFGAGVGNTNTTGSNDSLFGAGADVGSAALNYATAIGSGAVATASNQIMLGRANGFDTVQIPGALNAGTLNAATQFNISGNRVLSISSSDLFVGIGTGSANTTGLANSFFGSAAGVSNTSGGANSFFGNLAGNANTTGNNNSFFGRGAGASNTVGLTNSFFGDLAGNANTTGGSNSFFGQSAGSLNTTGGNNSFFGQAAGFSNATGSNNAALGSGADLGAAGLNYATAIGSGAVATASNQIMLGRANGSDTVQVPGNLNAAIVNAATQFNLGGVRAFSIEGTSNVFVGGDTGTALGGGHGNTFVGTSAGNTNNGGISNSFVGVGAGGVNSIGSWNTFFGAQAGVSNTTGSNNTALGEFSGPATGNLSNTTAVGAGASVTTSNSVVLGNNANVGIGTTAPAFKLQVVDASNTGLRVQTNTAGGTVGSFGANGAFNVDASGVAGGRFTVLENGNTGIGTNAPTNAKLQVNGRIRVVSGDVFITNPNTLIITSPNGACWGITVNNSGALSTFSTACP